MTLDWEFEKYIKLKAKDFISLKLPNYKILKIKKTCY